MSLKFPVTQLRRFTQLFQRFCIFFEIMSPKQTVACFLRFLVEDHPSLKRPVTQLDDFSQLFSFFAFLKIVCPKQPVADL